MSTAPQLAGLAPSVVLGKTGVRIEDDGAGGLSVRNFADTAFETVGAADAITDDHLVTLRQLLAALAGLSWKQTVRAATTVPGVLATDFEPGDTIDGVVLAQGNRILIQNQADPIENGIYVVQAAGAPARATDMAVGSSAQSAATIANEGTVNGDKAFTCTNDLGAAIVGTDGLTFILFATIVPGITTLADAAGSTGASLIATGSGPTATLRTILGQTGVVTATVSGGNVILSIDPLGGTRWARVPFAFDTPSPFDIGAVLPANAMVVQTRTKVDVSFDGAAPLLTIGNAGSPAGLQGSLENDLAAPAPDLYVTDNDDESFATTQLIGTLTPDGSTVGAGFVLVQYIITA